MGLGGQDLEELMIMEAMRLSLLEHEEQQRREAEEKKKAKKNSDGNAAGEPSLGESSTSIDPSNESSTPSRPLPSQTSVDSSSDVSGFEEPESRRRIGTENRWVRSRSVTPVSGQRNHSAHRAAPMGDSDDGLSSKPLPRGPSSPPLPALPSEAVDVSNGDASQGSLSTHNNGMYCSAPDPSSSTSNDYISAGDKVARSSHPTATPGAESFVSSLFTPGASGQPFGESAYSVLPSSPDISPDDEPLLNHSTSVSSGGPTSADSSK